MPEPTGQQDGGAQGATGTTTGGTTAGTSTHQTAGSGGASAGANGSASASTAAGAGGSTATGTSAGDGNGSATAGTGAGANGGTSSATRQQNNGGDNGAARRLARDLGNTKRELEQARQQIAAITGIQPPRQPAARRLPEGVTEDAIQRAREEFALVFPELAEFGSNAEILQTLRDFVGNDLPAFRDQHKHYWNQIGVTTGRALQGEIKTQIGELSEKGLRRLYNAFRAELESNEEFFDRYQGGDPNLVSEFVSDYKTDLDAYHTRQTSTAAAAASSAVARARRLPAGGSSSTVAPAGQATTQPANEEELHRGAFRRMKQRQAAATA